MEIRARYIQMGAFTLAVIAAGFAFVYWLNNAGGLRERAVYRIRFESSVSGLLRRIGRPVQRHPRRRGDGPAAQPRQPAAGAGDHRHRPQHPGARGHGGQHRLPGPDGLARDRAHGRRLGIAARGRQGRGAPARRRPGGRPEHVPGRARRAAPPRYGSGGERAAAAQHDRQSRHVLGRAGAQLRPPRRHRRGAGAHDGRRGRQGAAGHLRPHRAARVSRCREAAGRAAGDPRPDGVERARFGEDPHPLCRRRQLVAARCAMERHGAEAAAGAGSSRPSRTPARSPPSAAPWRASPATSSC